MAEREEFGDCLNEIKENRKVSEQHTFVSKEVSERAHHGKSGINFAKNYMPYIDKAVEQAKKFQAMRVSWLITLVAICGK